MDLDAWTTENTVDTARRKRLTMGYAVGAVTVMAALSFITYNAHGKVFEPDDTIDVDLAKAPVLEVEPEPEPEPKQVKKKKKKRRKKRKTAGPPPKEVPDSVPDEADPSDNPYDGDMDDVFDGEGGGDDAVKVVKAAPRPKKKKRVRDNRPARVRFVSERDQSSVAVAISQPRPSFSNSALLRAYEDGVRMLAYRCVVTTNGTLSRCKPISGHPDLDSTALSTLRTWRYKPATYAGKPVARWTTIRLPFRTRS